MQEENEMVKKLLSGQRDINGNILVGNYVAHPQEHKLANQFLDHHYGKEGTEDIHTLKKMISASTPDLHVKRKESDYHVSTNEPHPVLVHSMRRRILNGMENIQDPESFTLLFHKFSKVQHNLHASWRNSDMKQNVKIQPFSNDEQEKIVDLYDRYLTKTPVKHILDLAYTTAELRPTGAHTTFFNNPHESLIGRGEGLTDKKQRLRLHDILDRAESMPETNKDHLIRKRIAQIVRGYSSSYLRKSGEETKRLWTGLAKDPFHADKRSFDQVKLDTDSMDHIKRLSPTGEIYHSEDKIPGVSNYHSDHGRVLSDSVKVDNLFNAKLLTSLAAHDRLDHLGYTEAKDTVAHIFDLLDHHPNFDQYRKHGAFMSGSSQTKDTIQDAMFGPNYLKRMMAETLGRYKNKIDSRGDIYTPDHIQTGIQEIETHRKLRGRRI